MFFFISVNSDLYWMCLLCLSWFYEKKNDPPEMYYIIGKNVITVSVRTFYYITGFYCIFDQEAANFITFSGVITFSGNDYKTGCYSKTCKNILNIYWTWTIYCTVQLLKSSFIFCLFHISRSILNHAHILQFQETSTMSSTFKEIIMDQLICLCVWQISKCVQLL